MHGKSQKKQMNKQANDVIIWSKQCNETFSNEQNKFDSLNYVCDVIWKTMVVFLNL